MANKRPYMKFWIYDWRDDVDSMDLTLEEEGLYLRLIILLWKNDYLVLDPPRISKMLGINTKVFNRLWPHLSHKFEISGICPELIRHSRVTQEKDKAVSQSEINRINGKKGGNAKANAKKTLEQKPAHPDPNPNTDTDNKKTIEKKADPMIDEITALYKTINNAETSSGRANLEKLHEKKKIPYTTLKTSVLNYKQVLEREGKLGSEYTYRMRNFFGQKAYYQDYLEMPEMGPQNTSQKTGGHKAGVPTKEEMDWTKNPEDLEAARRAFDRD